MKKHIGIKNFDFGGGVSILLYQLTGLNLAVSCTKNIISAIRKEIISCRWTKSRSLCTESVHLYQEGKYARVRIEALHLFID